MFTFGHPLLSTQTNHHPKLLIEFPASQLWINKRRRRRKSRGKQETQVGWMLFQYQDVQRERWMMPSR
jgi:hypothetical protein